MKLHKSLVGATAIAFLVVGTTAMAQQQGTASGQPGTTSGPASGSSVEPSTQGAIGAGAPGCDRWPGHPSRSIAYFRCHRLDPTPGRPGFAWCSCQAGHPGRNVA